MRYVINTQGTRRHELSEKQVRCPRANTAYGCNVKPGYWITYREEYDGGTHGTRLGRVLGRIEWAEAVSFSSVDFTGYLSVLACADDLHHAYIRWVNPADVLTAIEQPPIAMLAFIGGDLPSPDMVHRLSEYGTLSENYVSNASHHIEAFKLGISPSAYDHGVRSICPECGHGIKADGIHTCPVFSVRVDGIGEVYSGKSYASALRTAAEYEHNGTPYTIVDNLGEIRRQYRGKQTITTEEA